MVTIDMTTQVDPRAEIADEVEIGPCCVIGPDATIGRVPGRSALFPFWG